MQSVTKKRRLPPVIALIIIYTISHWLLCVISGQWWDDWAIWLYSLEEIKILFQESAAMPWTAYNLLSVMWIPNCGYRIVVFLLFLATGLLFYGILCKIDFFTEEDSFWIAAIAMTVPVNDARATLICYGYSSSLTFFMIAFFIVTRLTDMGGYKKILMRIISFLFLLFSYITESLLVFTGVIWLYFFYTVCLKNKEKKFFYKIWIFFCSYLDYFVFPFAYYIIKNIFLKPYGRYETHNVVTLYSLIKGTLLSPLAAVRTGRLIGSSYVKQIGVISLLVVSIVAVVYLIMKRRLAQEDKNEIDLKRVISMFLMGGVIYFAGVLPYIVVRNGSALSNTCVGGRDTILAGFGIGIMAIGFARLLPVMKKIQNLFPILIIILGIFHFNDWYLNYQEDWYHQLEFAEAIKDNNGLPGNNTILCNFSNVSPNGSTRFYTLNGMSYIVTGKMDKFFCSRIDEIQLKEEFKEIFKNGYNCNDYDSSDKMIDGVMFINNAPINNLQLLKMRCREIVDAEAFEKDISRLTDVKYIRIDKDISEKIYEAYRKEELTSETLRKIVTDG